MTKGCNKVRVIVTPDFGERLSSVPEDDPVWIVDTPVNKLVLRQMWSEKSREITSFQVDEKTGPGDWLVSILDEIELHHGEHSQSPAYATLCVSGTGLSTELRRELESYGFNTFDATPDGFVANKVTA